MDGGSAASPPPETKIPTAGYGGGATEFLADLPSRGLFSTVLSSNPGGMRVYVCDHDTSPPEDQLIKTNQTNILIRSLMLKNQKGNSCSKDGKGTAASSRKRAAERALDGKAVGKRTMSSTQLGSSPGGAVSHELDKNLHSLTVERLRALLREKGLSLKGKKDELIARLKGADG